MRYLDIEGKIYYDVENGKIVFSEEPDKSFALKDMMSKRARTVFLMLLEKEGKWCTVTELENALGIASYGEKSPVVAAISEIRKCLNAHEIPCNKGDEKDPAKIIIRNESKTLISGNSGHVRLNVPGSYFAMSCQAENNIILDIFSECANKKFRFFILKGIYTDPSSVVNNMDFICVRILHFVSLGNRLIKTNERFGYYFK